MNGVKNLSTNFWGLSDPLVKGRFESIQMLRGVAVLMVVIYHIGIYEIKGSARPILGNYAAVGSAGVDIFFVISGFVMVAITQRPSMKERTPSGFLIKRIMRIYPLYWIYTFISLLIFWVSPNLANRAGGVYHTSIVRSALLLPDLSGAPIVGQGWTLIHEMYFYIGFALLLLAPVHLRGRLLMFWALLIAIIVSYRQKIDISFTPDCKVYINLIFSPMTLEFIGGCLIANLLLQGISKYGLLCAFMGSFMLVGEVMLGGFSQNISRSLSFGLPAMLVVYGVVSMEQKKGFLGPSFLRRVGDASYSIYLSHILCLSGCLYLWRVAGKKVFIENEFILIGMLIVVLVWGWLSYRHIEIPIQQFCKKYYPNSSTLKPQ